jgi:hypothetical protein
VIACNSVKGLHLAMEVQEFGSLSAYANFLYALKAKETKRQYPHRLDKFLSFIGLQGTIPEKCQKLCELKDTNLLESHLIRFINFHKERIQNKEISEGTLCNYVKAIRLCFSMNDIVINWKKISKGIPAVTEDSCSSTNYFLAYINCLVQYC